MKRCVSNDELLARFIVYHRWVRSDETVRSEAFMPDEDLETSVTRHLGLSEENIWKIGQLTVGKPPRKLLGRGDVKAVDVRVPGLDVEPRPEPYNPNHANIVDWPDKKDVKKNLAQLVAASTHFVKLPKSTP